MDVDVHARGVDGDVQHTAWELFGRHIRGIRLLECRQGGLAFDVSAVDEKVLIVAIRLEIIGSTDEPLDLDAVVVALHLNQACGEFLAEYGIDGVLQIAVPRRFQLQISVYDQTERDLRI